MSDEPIRACEKCYPPVWLILITFMSKTDSKTTRCMFYKESNDLPQLKQHGLQINKWNSVAM